jgi:hypothetical protein
MSIITMLTKPVTRPRYALPSFGAARLISTGNDVRVCTGDLSVTGFDGSFGDARVSGVRVWEPDH